MLGSVGVGCKSYGLSWVMESGPMSTSELLLLVRFLNLVCKLGPTKSWFIVFITRRYTIYTVYHCIRAAPIHIYISGILRNWLYRVHRPKQWHHFQLYVNINVI